MCATSITTGNPSDDFSHVVPGKSLAENSPSSEKAGRLARKTDCMPFGMTAKADPAWRRNQDRPNATTRKAMMDSEEGRTVQGFKNTSGLFNSLNS